MAFATIDNDFSYWQKQTKPLFSDLIWNIPEQKTGHINIIGGNSQSFHSVIRISEYLSQNFPLQNVTTFLPDSLRGQLPPLANVNFAPSTNSGSFAKSFALQQALSDCNFAMIAGDLSKNSATTVALSDALANTDDPTKQKPLLITRDTVDLLSENTSQLLAHSNLFIVASMMQLQKIFRAAYYPKMLMLSQPLISVIETLHKFTLTYPITILTFHQEQIIVAHNGQLTTTNISTTSYSPLSLWSGQLAAKVAALNLYNPNKNLEATTSAILFQ